jgi:hypothetical protein
MPTDSYKFELTDLTAFSVGEVGAAGAMGASLTDYTIKDGTANFNLSEPTQNEINIYNSDTPYALLKGRAPKDFTVEVLNLKLSQLPTFLGGAFVASVTTTPDRWNAPVIAPTIIMSVKLTSKDGAGNAVSILFPRCQLFSSMSGALSKTDLLGLKVKVVVLTPINGSGVALSAMGIDGEKATP